MSAFDFISDGLITPVLLWILNHISKNYTCTGTNVVNTIREIYFWCCRYYYGLDADESETESVCEDPVLKKEREWLQMAEDQKQQLQRPQDFFPKEEEEEGEC